MEQYSPAMEKWVAAQLSKTKSKDLLQLLTYYQQRGGPGLGLVEAECTQRGIHIPQLLKSAS